MEVGAPAYLGLGEMLSTGMVSLRCFLNKTLVLGLTSTGEDKGHEREKKRAVDQQLWRHILPFCMWDK